MGRVRRDSYFSRMAQIGNTTRFYSPQRVSHPSPRLSMTLPMFQLVKCPRCPTGSCLSQEPPLPAQLGPPLAVPPWLAVPREHQGRGPEIMGWGFSWPCPQNASHHHCRATASTVSFVALGVQLVKKQREPEPPLVLSHPADPPVQEDGGFTLHREGGAGLPYVRLGLRYG